MGFKGALVAVRVAARLGCRMSDLGCRMSEGGMARLLRQATPELPRRLTLALFSKGKWIRSVPSGEALAGSAGSGVLRSGSRSQLCPAVEDLLFVE